MLNPIRSDSHSRSWTPSSTSAGAGSKSHPREPSGRLILNEAIAARIPVARAPAIPMTHDRMLQALGADPGARHEREQTSTSWRT